MARRRIGRAACPCLPEAYAAYLNWIVAIVAINQLDVSADIKEAKSNCNITFRKSFRFLKHIHHPWRTDNPQMTFFVKMFLLGH